jgi:hypothetical protein
VTSGPGSARRIVSIASAQGWRAVYEREGEEAQFVTLVAWALVEAGNEEPRVVGLVQRGASTEVAPGTFGFADETDGFTGYSSRGRDGDG